MICSCPAPTAFQTIPEVICPANFGQIQKIAFQRLYGKPLDGWADTFHFNACTLGLLHMWTSRIAATDNKKIVISPFISAPADSGGDARMTSGGNDDLSGIPLVLGENPVHFTGQLRGCPQKTIAALKELMCEAEAGRLGVYLFDENGHIAGIYRPMDTINPVWPENWVELYGPNYDSSCDALFVPIPIKGLFIGDKIHGNYDAQDYNVISFYYNPGPYDVIMSNTERSVSANLGFNPLTDLQNPE